MEVQVEDKKNLVKCKNISKGELFMYESGIYLKTSTINFYVKDGSGILAKGNAVHLRSGIITFIDDNEDCELVNGTLKIKR